VTDRGLLEKSVADGPLAEHYGGHGSVGSGARGMKTGSSHCPSLSGVPIEARTL
jgi:hypothetical protein